MIFKALTFKAEEVTETGHFSGYANTWEVDQVNDRFLPGAFKRTIKAKKGKVPVLKGHDSQIEIGLSLQLSEDDVGLRVDDAVLYIDDKNPKNEITAAREEYVRMRRRIELGIPLGLSVGVSIPSDKATWDDERKGFDIKEAALWEFSTATFQANLSSMATAVKSIVQLPAAVRNIASTCTGPLCPSNQKAVADTIQTLQGLLAKEDSRSLEAKADPAATTRQGNDPKNNGGADPDTFHSAMTTLKVQLAAMRNKATSNTT
jgi:HK97 family phage prohead protease